MEQQHFEAFSRNECIICKKSLWALMSTKYAKTYIVIAPFQQLFILLLNKKCMSDLKWPSFSSMVPDLIQFWHRKTEILFKFHIWVPASWRLIEINIRDPDILHLFTFGEKFVSSYQLWSCCKFIYMLRLLCSNKLPFKS